MRKPCILFLLILTIAACTSAKKPGEVTAVYIPAANYSGLSCDELQAEAEKIRAKTPALEKAVQESYDSDKVAEQVGWWLLWPALFLMDGNAEEQTDLAVAKGQLEAIQSAAVNCKSRSPTSQDDNQQSSGDTL